MFTLWSLKIKIGGFSYFKELTTAGYTSEKNKSKVKPDIQNWDEIKLK